MAVAVQPSSETKGSSPPAPLWLASLVGGFYALGALAVVFYAVPKAWDSSIGELLTSSIGVVPNVALRFLVQIAAAVALGFLGFKIAGPNRPHGLRGGVFWAIVTIFLVFTFARWTALILRDWFSLGDQVSQFLFIGSFIGFGFLGLRFVKGSRFNRWAVGMDEGGWFSTSQYKRTQGVRVRRFTIVGVLLLAGSGILTMINTGHLPAGENWEIVTPFLPTITLLPNIGLTVPLILGALALWVAFRIVNQPSFADFLIATEAEMNKVSWTPRKRLLQDTVVVLATVLIITLFLFLVDVFWGWFLSRSFIGVIPPTTYKYQVTIESVTDPAKVEAIAAALSANERMPAATARKLVESAPQVGVENKALRPQVVGFGLEEDDAEELARRLKEAGANVDLKRSRGKQAAGELRW